jgi:hypothetical protein
MEERIKKKKKENVCFSKYRSVWCEVMLSKVASLCLFRVP